MKTPLILLTAFALAASAFGQTTTGTATSGTGTTTSGTTVVATGSASTYDTSWLTLPAPVATGSLTTQQQQTNAAQAIDCGFQQAIDLGVRAYAAAIAPFSDDSATGGLTPSQKLATLPKAQQVVAVTLLWNMANNVNGLKPGTVVNPTNLVVSGS